MTEQTCVGCGGTFTGRKRKYCRKVCRIKPKHIVPDSRQCPRCGVQFAPTRWDHLFCTKICYNRALSVKPKAHLNAQCAYCGKHYHPKSAERTRYCGRTCSYAAKRAIGKEKDILKGMQRAWKQKVLSLCKACGMEFVGRGQVCKRDACRRPVKAVVRKEKAILRRIQRAWRQGQFECKECGVEVVLEQGDQRRVFCSVVCAGLFVGNGNHRHRARKYGCYYEPVSAWSIIRRDHYICAICGTLTEPNDPVISGRYPTIDHIIPLSKGGPHKPSNLQCACRRCNSVKGNREISSARGWMIATQGLLDGVTT